MGENIYTHSSPIGVTIVEMDNYLATGDSEVAMRHELYNHYYQTSTYWRSNINTTSPTRVYYQPTYAVQISHCAITN